MPTSPTQKGSVANDPEDTLRLACLAMYVTGDGDIVDINLAFMQCPHDLICWSLSDTPDLSGKSKTLQQSPSSPWAGTTPPA
jgi:hypothetical protein